MSALFLVLVGWTFARTYTCVRSSTASPLPLLLQVHDVLMTGWVVLAPDPIDLHRDTGAELLAHVVLDARTMKQGGDGTNER